MSVVPIRVVPAIRTALRIDAMMSLGAAAYTDVFEKQVTTFELATAASQWTTECGVKPDTANMPDGSKVVYHIWGNNWGNITCKPNADCDKHSFVTNERIKKGATAEEDVWKEIRLYYKAYANPREGAIDYWKKMKQYFPKSLNTFQSGDMKLVAETLSKEGYYTALVSLYQKNLEFYFNRYVRLLTTGTEK